MHPSADDDAAVALLRALDSDPVTPSTVDIERAVREGRRRRRQQQATRSVALVAAVGLMVAGGTAAVTRLGGLDTPDQNAIGPSGSASGSTSAGASPSASATRRPPIPAVPPAAPTRCSVSTLPVPDGVKMGIVTGADPTGRIILGRSYLGDGDKQVIMWRDGRAQKVPMVGSDPALDDVNTAGTAVGVEYGPGEAGAFPMVYSGGTARRLATGDRTGGEASAINEAGTIAGSVGAGRRSQLPVRWAGPDSQPENLPIPAGHVSGQATDIDEDGTIVGYVGEQGSPYVWFPDGTHRAMPVPTLDGRVATTSDARSIRNGWVVGMANYGQNSIETRAVRWNLYTGEVTVFPEFTISASAVNAHGWQVGPAQTPQGLLRTTTATVTLPGLPLGNEAHSLSVIPQTISDDGRTIAGQSDDSSNTLRPVLWRCT